MHSPEISCYIGFYEDAYSLLRAFIMRIPRSLSSMRFSFLRFSHARNSSRACSIRIGYSSSQGVTPPSTRSILENFVVIGVFVVEGFALTTELRSFVRPNHIENPLERLSACAYRATVVRHIIVPVMPTEHIFEFLDVVCHIYKVIT